MRAHRGATTDAVTVSPNAVAFAMAGIGKAFAGKPALSDAGVTIRQGEIHALLGENGAGKSTLMTIACGIYQADAGSVLFDGERVTIKGPSDAHRLGIRMVHQHFKLVLELSVKENLLLATGDLVRAKGRAAVLAISQRVADELGWPLAELLPLAVAQLSVAAQQRIEIIKTLTQGAKVLILDEPTAVLTDGESDALMGRLRFLAESGIAVVIITHRLREVARYADRYTVMRRGATVATGLQQDIDLAGITELMVGAETSRSTFIADSTATSSASSTASSAASPLSTVVTCQPSTVIGQPALSINDVVTSTGDGRVPLRGVAIQVRSGEIYGVAGIGDNGQRELVDVVNGQLMLQSGQVVLGDVRVDSASTARRRERGLRVIPADRFADALCGDLSVSENFVLTQYADKQFGGPFAINRQRVQQSTAEHIQQYEIHGASPKMRTRLLSGGNAQKLLLARELQGDFRVIVAHSPTRGLDVKARAAVHRLLFAARDAGAAILLLSEDLDEVLLLSDRIGVLNRGKIVGELNGGADRQAVGTLMLTEG